MQAHIITSIHTQVHSIVELGRALGEHPRTRFVVVVDTLDTQTANTAYSQLSDVLTGMEVVGFLCISLQPPTIPRHTHSHTGGRSSGWPDNAILVLSVHSAGGGALQPGHPASYVARIPNLRLAMPNLGEAEYLVCVARMLGIEDPNGHAMMVNAMQVCVAVGCSVRKGCCMLWMLCAVDVVIGGLHMAHLLDYMLLCMCMYISKNTRLLHQHTTTQYGYKMDFTVRTAFEYAMFYFGSADGDTLEALEENAGEE